MFKVKLNAESQPRIINFKNIIMTKAEIVERLKENKLKTPKYSGFQDDNHATLDTMIRVIEQDISEFEINDWEDDDYNAGMSALELLDDSENIEDYLYPESL